MHVTPRRLRFLKKAKGVLWETLVNGSVNGKRTYSVTTCVDRLYASIEQPVLITRGVFHTLLQHVDALVHLRELPTMDDYHPSCLVAACWICKKNSSILS